MDRDRVMREMVESGLSATELGPMATCRPIRPSSGVPRPVRHEHRRRVRAGLLYRPDRIEAELEYVKRRSAAGLDGFRGARPGLVAAPRVRHPVDMSDDEWTTFLANLQRLEALVNDAGLKTALHPHWGLAIATGPDIDRLLESSDVGLCVDTGHVYLGGADPVEVARGSRARPPRPPRTSTRRAPSASGRRGPFPPVGHRRAVPLGQGGVDIAGVIKVLEDDGYRGWYVPRAGRVLREEPAVGSGPKADAVDSVAYLRGLTGLTGVG